MTQRTPVSLSRRMERIDEQALAEFRDYLRSWASARTVQARYACVRARVAEWGVAGCTEQNARAFFADMAADEKSKWSRSTYHGHLFAFGEFLVTAQYADVNFMENVRKTRPPKSEPRPLTEAQVAQVLAATAGETRDWMLLALHAGLRVHEIAKIRGEDVQPEGLWVEGKGDKRVTLPLHPDLWEVAQRYPRTGYWFPGPVNGHIRSNSISARVGRVFRTFGITGSIHRLRHTYGTRLIRLDGVNLRQVQKLMRHESLQTTAAYTAVDEDELRSAITRLPSTAA